MQRIDEYSREKNGMIELMDSQYTKAISQLFLKHLDENNVKYDHNIIHESFEFFRILLPQLQREGARQFISDELGITFSPSESIKYDKG